MARKLTPPQERNAPCACGSGKKYKKCCYLVEHAKHERAIAQNMQRAPALSEPESPATKAERARRMRAMGRSADGRPLPYGKLLPLIEKLRQPGERCKHGYVGLCVICDGGAKGDGKTNDAAAFNRAITNVGPDGVVGIPSGNYRVDKESAVPALRSPAPPVKR